MTRVDFGFWILDFRRITNRKRIIQVEINIVPRLFPAATRNRDLYYNLKSKIYNLLSLQIVVVIAATINVVHTGH